MILIKTHKEHNCTVQPESHAVYLYHIVIVKIGVFDVFWIIRAANGK